MMSDTAVVDTALVVAGTVEQVWRGTRAADIASPPPGELVEIDAAYHPVCGMLWDGAALSLPPPPPPSVPQAVSRLQGRLALHTHGLLAAVEAAVAAAGGSVAIWYADARMWHRNDPILLALTSQLGLTSEQVDALFVDAASY